jgi:hypothetical protein
MKPYNEQEFNRLCAEFIGWKQNSKKTTFYVDKNDGRYIYEIQDLKFHSDWNWIMKVVDKISHIAVHKDIEDFPILSCPIFSPKEAVVQVIWEFLNWYNNKSK